MAEEFQESDVVFSDYYDHDHDHNDYQEKKTKMKKMKMKMTKKKSSSANSNSVPVDINIPVNLFQYVDSTDEFEEEYQDNGKIITPPHVIVGRRVLFAEKMAFSVCSGNGRTLKGRDLSRVRNSILRMTGFLET